jgi:sulfur carrier protein ThiS
MPDMVKMSAATHPFKVERKDWELPEGLTISQMLAIAQPDSKQLEHAIVFVRGEIVPRYIWPHYKPRPGVTIEVRAFPVPRGGGEGGKNPLRIILTIAVIALAVFAGPVVAGWFFSFSPTAGAALTAFNALSAVATGAISAVGMLAVNAIAPIRPPKMAELSNQSGRNDSPTLFIEGARNGARPFSPVPSLLGRYRYPPPYASKPFTEVVGDKNFVRCLFVWGIGPVEIDVNSLRIGETPLSEFNGVQVEHREGYADDDPLTLFPATVSQEDFSVLLSSATSWVTRTSGTNADELSVDLTFPQGLVRFDDQGNRQVRGIRYEIQYRKVGDTDWLLIDTSSPKFWTTAPSGFLIKSGNDLTYIDFAHSRTSAIRHGIRWAVSERAQYEIRMRRVTGDTNSTQIFDTLMFTALKTITNEDPINSPVPVAKTVLVIQATDQLSNIVDEFNGIATTVAMDWDADTETWIERPTQNPASLFRHVLQGKAIASPLPDSRVDLETLQEWHEFCEERGFKFNMVRDFASSVWETLADIASSGRAAPAQKDGKWSVIIDKPISTPASFITPRNSFDFKAEKIFLDMPHAWRIRFPNEDQDFRFDERRVYRDGYNAANATLFEALELPGTTDPDTIYKLGRFRIAQILNMPERFMFKQDMEYLTYQRGSRVAVTHDVILIGLAYGRIKEAVLTGADVTGVILDETVTMEDGKDYGIGIRTSSMGQVTRQVVTSPGQTNQLTFISPIEGTGSPAQPVIVGGEVFGFGLHGQETDDFSILSIMPDANFKAQITAVPYRASVYNADSEEIPEFQTNLTPLAAIPAPSIRSVISDERVLAVGPGESLRVRISIEFDPLNESAFGESPEIQVQMRPTATGEPYFAATMDSIDPNHVFISGVRAGETWDIRMRYVLPRRLPGPWAMVNNHHVIGKSTPPSPLVNMTISAFGAMALIRWDKPSELDVLFGGQVVFRHSSALEGATWAESVSIGNVAQARTLFAALPLKEGTYMARVYDIGGMPSEEVTFVTTKQVSLLAFASVDSLDEAPSFSGAHSGTVEDSGKLKIDDTSSPRVLEATYDFAAGFDLTTVKRVRLTTRLSVTTYNILDTIDERLDNIDSWEDFDGSLEAGADAKVYVRHTDDDPAGSPVTWSEYERLESAEFVARGFEFYAELSADSEDKNILVHELGVDVEEVA